jgi:hypothetical protein
MTDRLHGIARVAALLGAIGSVVLTLYAGRSNNMPGLMILMSLWVIAPFIGYAVAGRFGARWPPGPRVALDGLIIVAAAVSLAVYTNAALRSAHPRATPFVAVPIAAWLLLIVIGLVALVSRRAV